MSEISLEEQYSAAEKAINKHENEIYTKYRGVLSVGVGKKIVRGQITDEFAIVIGIKRKIPLDQIPEDQRIPFEYDGIKTDIEQYGEIAPARSDQQKKASY